MKKFFQYVGYLAAIAGIIGTVLLCIEFFGSKVALNLKLVATISLLTKDPRIRELSISYNNKKSNPSLLIIITR